MISDSLETVRENKEIEAAVNRGLAAALLSDRATGAKVMRDAGVPNHVITRVLMGSHVVHRASDWKKE
ncbi:MAG: hypothetical protein ACXU7H_04580 [Burkholderiaceae bacterium]